MKKSMKGSSSDGMKKWFAACRYVKPDRLEEALENYSRGGFHLMTLGEMSFFYYEFVQTEPIKYRYIVDVSALPKVQYMQTGIELGWEYLGRTGNCYVWRKAYEERRPESFADKACRKKHCIRVGIAALFAMLFCIGSAAALIYGAVLEHKYGVGRYYIRYIVEAFPLVPLAAYFGWAANKLLH